MLKIGDKIEHLRITVLKAPTFHKGIIKRRWSGFLRIEPEGVGEWV